MTNELNNEHKMILTRHLRKVMEDLSTSANACELFLARNEGKGDWTYPERTRVYYFNLEKIERDCAAYIGGVIEGLWK